jgi:hypothetical protein
MREQIAKADPENTLWQTELASSLMQLAGAGDDPQSRLTRALSLLQKLDGAGKLGAVQKSWLRVIEQALATPSQQQ